MPIIPLLTVTLVCIRLMASDRTLVPPTSTANESSWPSPWTMKLNDMETALDGTASGIQAQASAFVPPPPGPSFGELGGRPFGTNGTPPSAVRRLIESDEMSELMLPHT